MVYKIRLGTNYKGICVFTSSLRENMPNYFLSIFCMDNISNFAWLMLAGFRVLVEQQPLEEDYSKFG